jgi:hypothetical protein
MRTSRKCLRLAEAQDLRRRPTLVAYLADGYCKIDDRERLMAFSVSLTNPSDSNNGVGLIELQVDYLTETGVQMRIKIPPLPDGPGVLVMTRSSRSLCLPDRCPSNDRRMDYV